MRLEKTMNYDLKKNLKKILKATTSKLLLFILLSLFLNLKSPAVANAQSVDLGIYPPLFQIQTIPPAHIKVPFFIENFQDRPVEVSLSIKPFTASNSENGELTYTTDTSSIPDPFLKNRIQVLDNNKETTQIVLSPKQKKDLTLQIDIPSNEPKGDYYLSIVFSSNGQPLSGGNFSFASGAIASNILLSIGPTGKNQAVIENFSTPLFVTSGPLPFSVRVKNTSDHFLTPKGEIVITNMFGQKIGKVDLLPVNILSNTIRRIPDSLQSLSASANDYNKIKTVVEKNDFPVAVWPEKFLLGPYTATLSLALSDQGPIYTRTVSFFAFPAEYILGILLVIAIVVFIVLRVKNARINT